MNGKQHRAIGAATGAGFTLAKYFYKKSEDPDYEFPWGEFILNTGIGYALGSLPDWIEPATNPNHRKFFHSITAGTLVGWGAFGNHTEDWDDDLKNLAQIVGMTYLSHLVADSTTPKAIPLMHPKFL